MRARASPPRPRRVLFFRHAECASVVFLCRVLVPERSKIATPRRPPPKASREPLPLRPPATGVALLFRATASAAERPRLRGAPLSPRLASVGRLGELRRPCSRKLGGSEPLGAVLCFAASVPRQARRKKDPADFWRCWHLAEKRV